MKKLILAVLTFLTIGIVAGCDPLIEEGPAPTAVNVGDFQSTINQVIVNGKKSNRFVCDTKSAVSVKWTDSVINYTGSHAVITMFATGNQSITVTGRNQDGSTFTKDFQVTVEEKSFPVPPEYEYLCGSNQKTWTWQEEKCFGNGGNTGTGPEWWVLNPADVTEQCKGKKLPADGLGATMTFTLKGLKIKKTTADQQVSAGTIKLDLESNKANNAERGLGALRLSGANIPCGYDFNGNLQPWPEYNIISLTPDKMVLAAREFNNKDNFWYFVFVPKK